MNIDLIKFRNMLVMEFNKHKYAAQVLENEDGTIPPGRILPYCAEATQALTLATIVELLDKSEIK